MSYQLQARSTGPYGGRPVIIYADRDLSKVLKVQQYYQLAFPDFTYTVMSTPPRTSKPAERGGG